MSFQIRLLKISIASIPQTIDFLSLSLMEPSNSLLQSRMQNGTIQVYVKTLKNISFYLLEMAYSYSTDEYQSKIVDMVKQYKYQDNLPNYIQSFHMNSILVSRPSTQSQPCNAIITQKDQVTSQKRFCTDLEPFNKFYEEWDGTQNQMHQKPMERFVKILTDRYLESKKPLSIVDLGCGYGKQAYNIKKKLEQNGVQIDIFYGYDISPELIDIANQKYSSENMKFFRKNLDQELNDDQKFDAIISFCALHWVNDIKSVSRSISRALKPQGLLLALIGIETEDFHILRNDFLNNSKWTNLFEEDCRKVNHFYFDEKIYEREFAKYFCAMTSELQVTPYHMSHDESVLFFGNWIQEVRHLLTNIQEDSKKEEIIRSYCSDLIDSFPLGMNRNVIKNEDGSVVYKQHLLLYEGKKQF